MKQSLSMEKIHAVCKYTSMQTTTWREDPEEGRVARHARRERLRWMLTVVDLEYQD
jgi:hypothetical protein